MIFLRLTLITYNNTYTYTTTYINGKRYVLYDTVIENTIITTITTRTTQLNYNST